MRSPSLVALAAALLSLGAFQAQTVPTEVQMPGTQPLEVAALSSPQQCDNCHGGYDAAVEPAHNWRGSLMAHASRDPLFWAMVAVTEQDFDGAGDLCLRCHVGNGWLAGDSTPTNGELLTDGDSDGVTCHLCHRMVDPDDSEHLGVQVPPFVANDGTEGWYGNGMFVLLAEDVRLGPYANVQANHSTLQSSFHRSSDFCGTCHDVSNPVVGDLAPGHGTMVPLAPGTYSGVPGAPVDQKAAFNNPPYAYGVVERTYREHRRGALWQTSVSAYGALPAELRDGAIEEAYLAAMASTPTGDYAYGAPRTFTCQTCHMPPVQGKGCNKNYAPVRDDLPLHDLVGGNYWTPDAILHMDALGQLPLGGGLTAEETAGLLAGKQRAVQHLQAAASLSVEGDTATVVNLTGHKLPTGYPEGRRMWLNVRWYSASGGLLREDGAYGPITADIEGVPTQVMTLLDLDDPHARRFESKPGMSQEWAALLVSLGYDPALPLGYDRLTGLPDGTLGELAAAPPGTARATFHFALNDVVLSDTRIPTYGMAYDEALTRSCLPVPASQYGDPGPGGVYDHRDVIALEPPPGAASAELRLLYQTTSWEFVQFLALANGELDPFLGEIGEDLLDAWLATGMAAPVEMASAVWTAQGQDHLVAYCFCDAGLAPCGNADATGGCANSTGLGATLAGTGSTSVAAGDLGFAGARMLPGQPALLFAGLNAVNGGLGSVFGDGLRCAGGGVARLGVRIPDAGGAASWGPGLASQLGVVAGDVRRFQTWYRDPQASPCGSGFNLSHGVEASFVP